MHPCERCGAPILEKYRICYLCMRDMQETQKALFPGQTPQNPVYTPPQVVCAPKRTETPYDARGEAIAKAHQDNMLANELLVNAILKLTEAVNARSELLKTQMGAK